MKQLFMHVGMPKCGSTSIQRFMFKNRDEIKKRGCLYPETINGWDQHAEIWPKYNEVYQDAAHIFDVRPYYSNKVLRSRCQTIVLSAEQFSESSINEYKFLTENIHTNYIIYFRNPLLHAQSAITYMPINYIAERGRPGYCMFNSNAFIGFFSRQINSLDIFCGGDLTSSAFIVKSYDQCAKDGGLIEDFYHNTIGQDGYNELLPPEKVNVGLKTDYAFFLAHLNMIPLRQRDRLAICDELRELSQNDAEAKSYRLFSRAQVEALPQYLIRRYEKIGLRAGDPDFWERGRDTFLRMEECPYRQLPADTQQRIMDSLCVDSQETILNAWIPRHSAGGLQGSGILPDIPTDEQSAWLIRQWHTAYARLSMSGLLG